MTRDEAKQAIVDKVISMQGCKITQLLAYDEMREVIDQWDLDYLVYELFTEGRLVEVEYKLPQLNYKTKSFLLPPGTEVWMKKT